VWGASSTPGPNAPLSNACWTSSQPQFSAQASFNQWTGARCPASKLLLGLPAYGYVSKSTATKLTGSYELPGPPADAPTNAHTARVKAAQAPLAEGAVSTDDPAPEPGAPLPLNFLDNRHDRSFERAMAPRRRAVGNTDAAATAGDLSSYLGQQIAFNQIVALGALKPSGSAFIEANGYTQGWDNCSDTPVSCRFSTRKQAHAADHPTRAVLVQHVPPDRRHV
jgi:chitinase